MDFTTTTTTVERALEVCSTQKRIVHTRCCNQFFVHCCLPCDPTFLNRPLFRIDGTCSDDGQAAGIGICRGSQGPGIDQFPVPITSAMDPDHKHTGQRAELLAALEAVRDGTPVIGTCLHDPPKQRVVASHSQYLVKGITEWYPTWRVKIFLYAHADHC